MSIEQQLSDLTNAVKALTVALTQRQQAPTMVAQAPVPAPIPTPAPVVAAAPAPTPVPPPAPVMPAPPTFVAAPAPVAGGAPFSDIKGLTEWVTTKYKALGAERGQKILGVMQGLGAAALTDIKPEQFNAFYAGVEAL
jgi:hypothetical protein